MVALTVANIKIHRILVSLASFNAMSVGRNRLSSYLAPLVGFGGEHVILEGSIGLLVIWLVEFFVVDYASAYNVILGRPTLQNLKAIPSTYH